MRRRALLATMVWFAGFGVAAVPAAADSNIQVVGPTTTLQTGDRASYTVVGTDPGDNCSFNCQSNDLFVVVAPPAAKGCAETALDNSTLYTDLGNFNPGPIRVDGRSDQLDQAGTWTICAYLSVYAGGTTDAFASLSVNVVSSCASARQAVSRAQTRASRAKIALTGARKHHASRKVRRRRLAAYRQALAGVSAAKRHRRAVCG